MTNIESKLKKQSQKRLDWIKTIPGFRNNNTREIKKTLNEWGIHAPDNRVGGIIKSLAPNNQSIKIKTSEGVRYYKLSWRDRSGNQDMPF